MISLRETPWTNPSSDNQRLHAILHIHKAAGKLSAILENEGHGGDRPGEPTIADEWKYLADLVICAIRMPQQDGIDLESAVLARQQQRNPHV